MSFGRINANRSGGILPTRVADLSRDSLISSMAERIIAGAPERFSIVGSSLGGYVALKLLRRVPNRIARVVLVGTTAKPDDDAKKSQRKDAIRRASDGQYDAVVQEMAPNLVAASSSPSVAQQFVRMAKRVGSEAFARQQVEIISRVDSRPSVTNIRCPVLLIFGSHDIPTPCREGEWLRDTIPGSQLSVLPNCGHLASIDQPQATSDLMRNWLT